jgi:hypothetical protein
MTGDAGSQPSAGGVFGELMSALGIVQDGPHTDQTPAETRVPVNDGGERLVFLACAFAVYV